MSTVSNLKMYVVRYWAAVRLYSQKQMSEILSRCGEQKKILRPCKEWNPGNTVAGRHFIDSSAIAPEI
jgi:hypothetical protein